jgi:hypothetical protein
MIAKTTTKTAPNTTNDVEASAKILKYLKAHPQSYTYQIAPTVASYVGGNSAKAEQYAGRLLRAMAKAGKVKEDEPNCWEATGR